MRRNVKLMAIVVALVLVAAGCGSDEPTRDSSGEIVEAGDLNVLTFEVGDCFDDPPEMASLEEIVEVQTVEAVPCTQTHDNEVISVFDLGPAAFPVHDDAPYPGDDAIVTAASDACYDEFEPFVGIAYEVSILDYGAVWPNEQTWDSLGDREVVCFVYRVDLVPMTGSQRNVGV